MSRRTLRWSVPLVLLCLSALACDTGGRSRRRDAGGVEADSGDQAGDTGSPAPDAGRTGPQTDAGSSGSRDTGAPTEDAGGACTGCGAPRFLNLNTNLSTMVAGQSLVVTAVVTDPDGVDDLIGGELVDPGSGATYGAFATAAAEGAYQLDLTWRAINDVAPIDGPASGAARRFRARFFDVAGNEATREVSITLKCSDTRMAPCGGECFFLALTAAHCGECNRACPGSGYTACSEGAMCSASYYAAPTDRSCDAICGDDGYRCDSVTWKYHWNGATVAGACNAVPPRTDSTGVSISNQTCSCSLTLGSPPPPACLEGAERTVAACTDGCSNDGDRYIDCEDRDCCSLIDCAPGTYCGDR